ncbi:cell adhesion protein, partial [Clostridium botulinum]|nr:cell adhesion protein [Clostridium botulinum]
NVNKYLINQNENYYSTNSNFLNLGQPIDNTQLENWYNKYGADYVNIIIQNLNNKEFPMSKDENGIWKTDFELDINEVIDSIELIDTDENNKSIKYNCNDYRILDLCDDQFKLTMCKIK